MWTYYDRENYEIYRKQGSQDSARRHHTTDTGPHGLALQHRVPIFELKTTEGLWLMNKAALLQLEHFNKSNALAWALTMGCLRRRWSIRTSRGRRLSASRTTSKWGRTIGLAGPSLKAAFTVWRPTIWTALKDEIYRVCYLLSQAGKSDSGGLPQSGLSKQMDFSITQEILQTYGDIVKSAMRQILQAVALARKDDLLVDVSGLDEFDIGDFSRELSDAKNLLALGIQSKTLKQQMFKKLAFKYLSDSRQEIKNQISAGDRCVA